MKLKGSLYNKQNKFFFIMKAYDIILEAYQAIEIADNDNFNDFDTSVLALSEDKQKEIYGCEAYARGLDFSCIDTQEENIKYATYISTIEGIDIFYDYGADYYFFCPNF